MQYKDIFEQFESKLYAGSVRNIERFVLVLEAKNAKSLPWKEGFYALAKAIFDPNEVLDLGMTVCMYSMNRENADKIYDFSRQNFQRYFEGDQVFFDDTGVALNSGEDSENISAGGSGGASGGSSGSGTDTVAVTGNAKPFGGTWVYICKVFLRGGKFLYIWQYNQ